MILVYFIMKNYKVINSHNLLHNLSQFNSKKVCAMVKANAYGHGVQEVVSILSDKVECFAVANEVEGSIVRKYTQKPIIVVGKAQDYMLCRKHNLEIMVESLDGLKLAQKHHLETNCHLKINCGMNRFGLSSLLAARIVNKYLKEHKILLKSIFCHFPNTDNKIQTKRQYKRFLKLRNCISQKTVLCLGGSNVKNYPFDFDMIRVGIGLYGYEMCGLLPVLKIKSQVVKVFYAHKGEYIGYGKKYRVKKCGFFAIVPVGYGDGLFRNLSGKFCVLINGKSYHTVGNICIDMFFVKIDDSVKVGDEVIVFDDAKVFAKKLGSITYEVLTNFSKLRADTVIE
jgi:alanine racemase